MALRWSQVSVLPGYCCKVTTYNGILKSAMVLMVLLCYPRGKTIPFNLINSISLLCFVCSRSTSGTLWNFLFFYQRVIIMNHPPTAPPSHFSLSSIIFLNRCAVIVFLSLTCHSHLPERAGNVLLSPSRHYPGSPLAPFSSYHIYCIYSFTCSSCFLRDSN